LKGLLDTAAEQEQVRWQYLTAKLLCSARMLCTEMK
jgi:hypothetical protein